MRKYVFAGLCLLIACFAKAQTTAEWLQQKQTAIKYLLEQVAAFHSHIGFVKKGYQAAKNGLQDIERVKSGDRKLHQTYFTSLSKVNPYIATYPAVSSIIGLQQRILKAYAQQKAVLNRGGITVAERSYCHSVFTNLLTGCDDLLAQLALLIEDGAYHLKDNERISRMETIHQSMQDNYDFIKAFGTQLTLLSLQRRQEASEIKNLHRMLDK